MKKALAYLKPSRWISSKKEQILGLVQITGQKGDSLFLWACSTIWWYIITKFCYNLGFREAKNETMVYKFFQGLEQTFFLYSKQKKVFSISWHSMGVKSSILVCRTNQNDNQL